MNRIISISILLVVLTTLGCGNGTTTLPPTSIQATMSIDQSPNKPMTRIDISVAVDMWLTLTIRGPEGGLVRVLYEGQIQPGQYSYVWNAMDDRDEVVASGPYWALMANGQDMHVRAMMLVK